MSSNETVAAEEVVVQAESRRPDHGYGDHDLVFEPVFQRESRVPVAPGQLVELSMQIISSGSPWEAEGVFHNLSVFDDAGKTRFELLCLEALVVRELAGDPDVAVTIPVPFAKHDDGYYVFQRGDLEVNRVLSLRMVARNMGTSSQTYRYVVYGRRSIAPSEAERGEERSSGEEEASTTSTKGRSLDVQDSVFEPVKWLESIPFVLPGQTSELNEIEGPFKPVIFAGEVLHHLHLEVQAGCVFEVMSVVAVMPRRKGCDLGVAIQEVVPFVKDGDRYVFTRSDLEAGDVTGLKVVVRNGGAFNEHCRCVVYGRRSLAASGAENQLSNVDRVIEQCDRDERLEEQHTTGEGRGPEDKSEESIEEHVRRVIGGELTTVGVGPVQVGSGERAEIVVRPRRPFRARRFDVDPAVAPDFDLVDVRVGETSQLVVAGPLDAQLFDGGRPLESEMTSADRPLVIVVVNKSDSAKTFRAALAGSLEEYVESDISLYHTTVGCGPVWVEGGAATEIVVPLRTPFRMRRLVVGLNACYFDLVDVRVGGKSQLLSSDPLGAQFFAEGMPLYTEVASTDKPLVFFVKNTSNSAKVFRAALVGQGRRQTRG